MTVPKLVDIADPLDWSSNSSPPSNLITETAIKDIKSKKVAGRSSGEISVGNYPETGLVALKRLRVDGDQTRTGQRPERALRQTAAWLKLEHPNVLPFIGICKANGHFYLVSLYIKNGSLAEYVRVNLNTDRPRLLLETAAGLVYLRESGIIHGNIKASNVLVTDDVHARVCDFGLEKHDSDVTDIALQGIGILRWQSPELWEKDATKTFESDVWAFAMTIYEVLSDHLPFHNYPRSDVKVVVRQGERPPKDPKQSLGGRSYALIWDVAADCWVKDPTRRISIHATHNRLEAAVADKGDGPRETKGDVEQPSSASGCPVAALRMKHRTVSQSTWISCSWATELARNFDFMSETEITDLQIAIEKQKSEKDVIVAKHYGAGAVTLKRVRLPEDQELQKRQLIRFLVKACIWRMFNHTFVLPFLGVLKVDDQFYFVSQYIENGSIMNYIRKNPKADRMKLLQETAAALVYLHCGENIIHGDIKASNILISFNVRAVLCDFGMKSCPEEESSPDLPPDQDLRWYSPELQMPGEKKTFQSDVYAFGMTIYEVLSDKAPFHKLLDNKDVLEAVKRGDRPQTLPEHSPTGTKYDVGWSVATSCWEADPSKRPTMAKARSRLGHSHHHHPERNGSGLLSRALPAIRGFLGKPRGGSIPLRSSMERGKDSGMTAAPCQRGHSAKALAPKSERLLTDREKAGSKAQATQQDVHTGAYEETVTPHHKAENMVSNIPSSCSKNSQPPLSNAGTSSSFPIAARPESTHEPPPLSDVRSPPPSQSPPTSAATIPLSVPTGPGAAYNGPLLLPHSRRAPNIRGELTPTRVIPCDERVFSIKVLDYGFKPGDKRRQKMKTIDLYLPSRPPSPAPGGFLRPLEPEEIKALDSLPKTAEDSIQESEPPPAGEAPFVPGLYRALKAFDAKDDGERSLKEGEQIWCDLRGGDGQGWVIVSEIAGQARELRYGLVPEGFLEIVYAF